MCIRDSIYSGHWAKRSISEAKKYTNVNIAASSEDRDFTYFPKQSSWNVSKNTAYLHITPNETIGGLRFKDLKDSEVPIVADYSSSILSEVIEVNKFSLIYGGAQKNIGPAGLGFAIIKKELLGKAQSITPTMLNYSEMHEDKSMYNTPPTFAWYVAGKIFRWLKSMGGVSEMENLNKRKAKKIYSFIDQSDFYENKINKEDRSIMNIPFQLNNEDLNSRFLEESRDAGLLALKGHRSVGGMRASIYNAMPEEGVDALINFMRTFEKERS